MASKSGKLIGLLLLSADDVASSEILAAAAAAAASFCLRLWIGWIHILLNFGGAAMRCDDLNLRFQLSIVDLSSYFGEGGSEVGWEAKGKK